MFLLFSIVIPVSLYTTMAQEVEVYPGGIPLSATERADIPVLQLSSQSAATPLPSSVLNNEKIYFPPIYNQGHYIGCCVQAAEIGHTFTYEMNRLRNVAAGSEWDSEDNPNNYYNLYHPHFSFNFLNVNS